VASDLSTTYEWVERNRNGLLVTPCDAHAIAKAILTLLSDEKQRYEMAQRNAEMMRLRADKDIWMEQMERLYFSLVAGGQPGELR
jgi:glycosyltransferase involved in cell wall biosynthesis